MRRIHQLATLAWCRRRRRRRNTGRLLRHQAARLIHHLLRHRHAHGHLCAETADAAIAALFHPLRHLEFDVVVQVADGGHARALVDRTFDFGGNGNVFDDESRHLETVLGADRRVDER